MARPAIYLACAKGCGMPLERWWKWCPACGQNFPRGASQATRTRSGEAPKVIRRRDLAREGKENDRG